MGKPLKIGIAGCGPAGLTAGLLLARAGHHVTLFDRWAAPAPVGSGLMIQPAGLAVLQAMGLTEPIRRHGQEITHLLGRAVPSQKIVLDVRLKPTQFSLGIHRACLFEVLYQAIMKEPMVRMEPASPIAAADNMSERPRLIFANGYKSEAFDLVIDALGVRSPLSPKPAKDFSYGALWATLNDPTGGPFLPSRLEQRYRGAHQMAGVMPIGHGASADTASVTLFWSLKYHDYAAWRAAGLDKWKADITHLWPETAPLIDQIHDPSQLTLARYGHRTLRRPYTGRLAHVGDSFHSTSPQLGQGANMGLLDAYALAQAIKDHPDDLDAALRLYGAMRRLHVWLYQTSSRIFTPFYQSDSRLLAALRDYGLSPLTRQGPLQILARALVTGMVANPLRRLGLKAESSDDVSTATVSSSNVIHRAAKFL